jgi:hypothetical protein
MATDPQRRATRFRILLGVCGAAAFVLAVISWFLAPGAVAAILGLAGLAAAVAALLPLPAWRPGPPNER